MAATDNAFIRAPVITKKRVGLIVAQPLRVFRSPELSRFTPALAATIQTGHLTFVLAEVDKGIKIAEKHLVLFGKSFFLFFFLEALKNFVFELINEGRK